MISDPPALLTFNCLIPNSTSSKENGWLILSFVEVFNKRRTYSSKSEDLFNLLLKCSIKSVNTIEEVFWEWIVDSFLIIFQNYLGFRIFKHLI